MTREPADDLDPVSEWLRSERAPFTDEDRAAMRRGVWREIETKPAASAFFRPARLVLAAAALAVLVAALWLRPTPSAVPVEVAVHRPPRTSAAAVQPPAIEELLGPPATGHVRPGTQRRRPSPESVPVRIEFQTANPEVRIIWLVKKGEATPPPLAASRRQEVS